MFSFIINYRNKRSSYRNFYNLCLLIFLILTSCNDSSLTIKKFEPLKKSETFSSEVDFKNENSELISRINGNSKLTMFRLGESGDNGAMIFSEGKRCLALERASKYSSYFNLWYFDGEKGEGYLIGETMAGFNISSDSRFLFFDDLSIELEKDFQSTNEGSDVRLILFDLINLKVIKGYLFKKYQFVFWPRDIDNERIEDKTKPLFYDSKSKSFEFKLVNSSNFVEKFSLSTLDYSLTLTRVSKKTVELP